MEQALILGKISHRVPSDILEKFKIIEGVRDANLIYGPYDFYVTVKTETKEEMGDIAYKIRSIDGVIDSLTCYVVSFSDIRPEASRARYKLPYFKINQRDLNVDYSRGHVEHHV